MNRLVYVCHPWREPHPTINGGLLRPICEAIQARGDIPIFAPFVFPWLDDAAPDDRAAGMEMGLHLLALCREVQVYRPDGATSEGMQKEILRAHECGICVLWMDEQEEG